MSLPEESESEVAQSCPTLSDPMDYSLPGSSVHRIFQARVLEWGAVAFSASMSITNSQSLFKLMSIESVNAIQPSHPLSSHSPPALNLSQHQGLSQSQFFLIRWPKY